jgi:mRNA interferase RelE/StbE
MSYTVFASPAGQKTLNKLPEDVQKHLIQIASVLETDPLAGEQLKGSLRFLRSLHTTYQGTSYRLVYEVIERAHEIHVHLIGVRENFYKRLQRLKLKPAA